jgi:hypothetical protein
MPLNRKSIDIYYLFVLFLTNLLVIGSIIILKCCPQNDIEGILKISSLEGDQKWINGFYGPGYTYLSLIFSPSIISFASIYGALVVISSVITYFAYATYTKSKSNNEKVNFYLSSTFVLLTLLFELGQNYSDGIFVLMLYIGFLVFAYYACYKKNELVSCVGALIVGISILFRHHGIIIVSLLSGLYLYFLFHYEDIPLRAALRKFFLPLSFILLPTVASYLYLPKSAFGTNWQLFNIYIFLHDINWFDVKSVINSQAYIQFSISGLLINDLGSLINAILSELLNATIKLWPIIGCMLLLYAATRNRFQLIMTILFVGYVFAILPGWSRGYYPGLLLLLISLNSFSKEISINNKHLRYAVVILLSLSLVYSLACFLNSTYSSYKDLNLVGAEIKPLLDNYQVKRAEEIFTDDFDLYIPALESDSYRMCNMGGWTLLHPYFSSYEVEQIIRGDKNKFCDVKALIIINQDRARELLSTYSFRDVVKASYYTIFIK